MPNIQYIQCDRNSFPVDAGLEPITLEEDAASIRRGGGAWNDFPTDAASAGKLKYCNDNLSWYEITVPEGISRVLFHGFRNSNGATFDALKNGVLVGSGSQYADPTDQGNYFDFAAVVPGDVLRLMKTGGPSFLNDLITLYP